MKRPTYTFESGYAPHSDPNRIVMLIPYIPVPDYPLAIPSGGYTVNDVAALLKKYKEDPEYIEYIASMMEV